MNNIDYITGQLARGGKKRIESYVINRIWNQLDDISIKIITQQCIILNKRRALSDLYFPQIGIHVEVDEGHHENQKIQDATRERDIINATSHKILRIRVYDVDLEEIHRQVNVVIFEIRSLIEKQKKIGVFVPWDIESEFNPETYIKTGYIDSKKSVAFRSIYEACNCFGHNYKGLQRGFTSHGREDDCELWFPSLFRHKKWDNSVNADESEIYERPVIPIKWDGQKINSIEDYFKLFPLNPKRINKRIVFAYAKDNLGKVLYRFKGVYQYDAVRTLERKTHTVYRRIATRVRTYPMPS